MKRLGRQTWYSEDIPDTTRCGRGTCCIVYFPCSTQEARHSSPYSLVPTMQLSGAAASETSWARLLRPSDVHMRTTHCKRGACAVALMSRSSMNLCADFKLRCALSCVAAHYAGAIAAFLETMHWAACSDRQHVPVAEYATRLRSMVEHLRAAGAHHPVIIAPPPVDESARRVDRMRVNHIARHCSCYWCKAKSTTVILSGPVCMELAVEVASHAHAQRLHPRTDETWATAAAALDPRSVADRCCGAPQKWGLTEEQVADPDRLNHVTGDYAAAAGAVAAEVGAPFMDTWTEFRKQEGWHSLLSDGLHLSPAGSAALYTLLQRTIDRQLPQLRCYIPPSLPPGPLPSPAFPLSCPLAPCPLLELACVHGLVDLLSCKV